MENISSRVQIQYNVFLQRDRREIENFKEQNENLMTNDDDKMKEVELKNESRAHAKTKKSLDERGKEESRNLCEAKKSQSMDIKLGSKKLKTRKFESSASKLIRILELGQTDTALNKYRMGKLNLKNSVDCDIRPECEKCNLCRIRIFSSEPSGLVIIKN